MITIANFAKLLNRPKVQNVIPLLQFSTEAKNPTESDNFLKYGKANQSNVVFIETIGG